jgi:glycine dehydrogenase
MTWVDACTHATGMKIVPVKNEAKGAIDMVDLKAQCEKHKDQLAAIMVGV